jgi:hypothetical protein
MFSKTRRTPSKISPRLCKYITRFIQGTPNDFLHIHLFLGQASVSRLGMTLVIKTPHSLGLGGVSKNSVVVLILYGTDV